MNTTKTRKIKYALSIHMKYGEVLHIEDLSKEEKDRYVDLAKHEDKSMLVEDNTSVRHLLSKDISKISIKPYDETYEKYIFQGEKMLFSESSLGRRLFVTIIKVFVGLSVLGFIGAIALEMIEGNILDVFLKAEIFGKTLAKGLAFTRSVFSYTVALMLLLNVVDIVLGLKAHYFMNQDGEDPAENSRVSNVMVTIGFIVVFTVIRVAMSGLINLL